jgi:diamine N-acetyltransferase
MFKIRYARPEDSETIRSLAEATWWPTYNTILQPEQIRYMLDHIYDIATISTQIKDESQQYLVLEESKTPIGFASFSPRKENPDVFKLHKLYILPEVKGKGLGKLFLNDIEEKVKNHGINRLELNVNKYNPSKSFYEKMGYSVLYEEDIPIGSYWMNDFVMGKDL